MQSVTYHKGCPSPFLVIENDLNGDTIDVQAIAAIVIMSSDETDESGFNAHRASKIENLIKDLLKNVRLTGLVAIIKLDEQHLTTSNGGGNRMRSVS